MSGRTLLDDAAVVDIGTVEAEKTKPAVIVSDKPADVVVHLCADISRLCDILRGERAYLALCAAYPSRDPSAPARVSAAQLREKNCLVLLKQKRAELINALEALAE